MSAAERVSAVHIAKRRAIRYMRYSARQRTRTRRDTRNPRCHARMFTMPSAATVTMPACYSAEYIAADAPNSAAATPFFALFSPPARCRASRHADAAAATPAPRRHATLRCRVYSSVPHASARCAALRRPSADLLFYRRRQRMPPCCDARCGAARRAAAGAVQQAAKERGSARAPAAAQPAALRGAGARKRKMRAEPPRPTSTWLLISFFISLLRRQH